MLGLEFYDENILLILIVYVEGFLKSLCRVVRILKDVLVEGCMEER